MSRLLPTIHAFLARSLPAPEHRESGCFRAKPGLENKKGDGVSKNEQLASSPPPGTDHGEAGVDLEV